MRCSRLMGEKSGVVGRFLAAKAALYFTLLISLLVSYTFLTLFHHLSGRVCGSPTPLEVALSLWRVIGDRYG